MNLPERWLIISGDKVSKIDNLMHLPSLHQIEATPAILIDLAAHAVRIGTIAGSRTEFLSCDAAAVAGISSEVRHRLVKAGLVRGEIVHRAGRVGSPKRILHTLKDVWVLAVLGSLVKTGINSRPLLRRVSEAMYSPSKEPLPAWGDALANEVCA